MKIVFTILKFVLIWLVIAAAVIFGAIFFFDNIMYGVRTLIVLFAIWLVLFLVIKLLKRQIAKKRVSRLVDLKKGDNVEEEEEGFWFPFKSYLTEDRTLYRRIDKIIKYIKRSRLGIDGNAVYAKPWYLVVGDKDSGKSTLLNRSDIHFPTVNCPELKTEDDSIQFYLTNEAVYIDMKHSFIPGEGGQIPLEFSQLLKALRAHRPKEPINGVILAVSATELSNDVGLEDLAKKHSFYVNYIMQYAKVQLPVQLLVTHIDNMSGFSSWVDLLNSNQLKDALGNHNVNNLPANEFIDRAFDVTGYKISKMISYGFASAKKIDPYALSFAKGVSSLRERVQRYSEIVFAANNYQEASFLTGLYFTGTQQKNTGELSVCFAHALISSVFSNDRRRMHMLSRYRQQSWLLSGSFLLLWGALVCVSVLGAWQLLRYDISDVVDLQDEYDLKVAQRDIVDILDVESVDSSALGQKINTYAFLRFVAEQIAEDERSWVIPWGRLAGQRNVAANIKASYYQNLQNQVIVSVDDELEKNINFDFSDLQVIRSSREEIDKKIVDYARLLYKRLAVLRSYLDGADEAEVRSYAPVFIKDSGYFDENELVTNVDIDTLNELYLQSLFWYSSSDKKFIVDEYNRIQALLVDVIDQGSGDLRWIIGWADRSLPNDRIALSDFFVGSGSIEPPVILSAAYTEKGAAMIDDFIVEMQFLFNEQDAFYQRLNVFRDTYVKSYIGEWSRIAQRATNGLEKLRGRDEWLALMNQLSNQESNPYLALLDRAHKETLIIATDDILKKSRELAVANNEVVAAIAVPQWVSLLDYFQRMKQFGAETDEGKDNSALTKTALKVVGKAGKAGKAVAKVGKKANKVAKKSKFKLKGKKKLDDNLEKAAADFDKILLAISDAAFNAEIRSAMYKDIEALFKNPDNPSAGSGALAQLYGSYKSLQFLIGLENVENRPFWSLIFASIDTVQRFMLQEAQVELNSLWGQQILGELQGAPKDSRLEEILFKEKDGLLWKFYDDNLEPFLEIKKSGIIVPKIILKDTKFDFTQEFIDYYGKARDGLRLNKDVYPIYFETSPVSVNPESLFKPVKTTLYMPCGEKNYTSINLNFYSRYLFEWSSACGDLTLDISFSLFTLSKTYPAPDGFANFLRKFKGDTLVLTANDFPRQQSNLNDINVNTITLNYKVIGKEEFLKGIDGFPKVIPETIAVGWN